MRLDFVKLHGLGNDFIFVDDFSQEIELTSEQVMYLCDRHFGIGADGVILVRPSIHPECVAYMHYINSDGSLSEMCGNGIRCFAKYLVDHGFVNAEDQGFIVDTLGGPKPISFETDNHVRLTIATVDMGRPKFDPKSIPTTLLSNAKTPRGISFINDVPVNSPWGEFKFTCVSMGNPHAVCFIKDWQALPNELFYTNANKGLDALNLDLVGAFFESHDVFPERANIEFACVAHDGIHMRVYERGCGETLACGTGACATNVAACVTGRAGCKNSIWLRGGVLEILWDDNDHVMMTGPATEVFSGSIWLP